MADRQDQYKDQYNQQAERPEFRIPGAGSSFGGKPFTPAPAPKPINVPVPVPTPMEIFTDDAGVTWAGHFGLQSVGLTYTSELTEFEWADFFKHAHSMRKFAKRFSRASQWILADYFRIGADEFGRTYEQMAAATGYEVSTVENYASTSRNFDELSRLNSPSFSHAQAVARLPYDARLAWLAAAKEHRWSVDKMVAELEGKPFTESGSRKPRKRVKFSDVKNDLERLKAQITPGRKAQLREFLRQYLNELEREEQGG